MQLRTDLGKKTAALLGAVILLALDQATKYWAVVQLRETGRLSIRVIPGLLEFTYLENPAAAFGLFGEVIWIVSGLTWLVSAGIIAALFLYKQHSPFSYTAAALLLSGGVGNLIDRMIRGFVVDFIHVLFFGYIFNVADCCVTIGAGCFICHYIWLIRRDRGQKLTESGKEEAEK